MRVKEYFRALLNESPEARTNQASLNFLVIITDHFALVRASWVIATTMARKTEPNGQ